jgi:hypothetical protein
MIMYSSKQRADKRPTLFAGPLDWLLEYNLARSVVFAMTINGFAYKHGKRGKQGFAPTFDFILGSASFMRRAAYAPRAQFSTPLYVLRS